MVSQLALWVLGKGCSDKRKGSPKAWGVGWGRVEGGGSVPGVHTGEAVSRRKAWPRDEVGTWPRGWSRRIDRSGRPFKTSH